ncbi:putative ABC transport system ATP-binding protein [Amycolatopsis arida]|uniref:Putative ABC transport system ATP-binding protein n=1 Tax=Amycolatopsis arida TaxID=587909 RepID=A0A1I5ZRK0_9PSEU|nr:ABC transporter ATP-binding protein [Amycolatopsis arida]TDX89318.1 putative ABC transport system ATP-binding protein [Amycolatopsis arida]SFQ59109.1 putative ABC transport system ATP-binding protein [Amycolatopsis arida]
MPTQPTGRSVLRRAVLGQRRLVLAATALAATHQAGEALVPVVIGVVVDQAVATGSVPALLRWLAVLAALFLALSTGYRFAARTAERAAEQAGHELRVALTERVLDPRGGAERGRLPGALVSIATGDAKRVGTVNGVLPFGVAAVAGLLVAAVALLRMSVPLGLLVLLGTPPLLWLAHLVGRPLERRSGVEQERAAQASGIAADLVAGLRVLKGIGAEPAAVARYRRTSRASLAATLRAARARAWHDGAVLALTGIFIAIVALVGGWLAMAGAISVGQLVAAVGLAQFLLTPFQIFSWVNGQLAQGRASADRIASVLAAPYATGSGAPVPEPVSGGLRLRGVGHGALRDVTFEVEPGELVGVVAPDPAGATALLECLGREVDPAAGTVELDGVPLTELDPEALRAAVVVAAHDADLFEGTLLDNVLPATRSGEGGGGERVRRALAAAAADEVAASLPDGPRTVLAERARSLSGGQRQRVALARALAADPPVLVVHDPTTAVDAVTEARIAGALRELRRGRTTVVVATSPALLAATDRVVLLAGGTVAAEGPHTDLVATRTDYREVVLS